MSRVTSLLVAAGVSDTALGTILLVEDQIEIADFVAEALRKVGHSVVVCGEISQACQHFESITFDLVLLDLGLPDGDGLSFIERVRTWSQVPLIVLSARGAESDKIFALDAGADDYLVKPFSINELLARVRTQVRRIRCGSNVDVVPVVRFGDVLVERHIQRVSRLGVEVHLTQIEYQLLCVFLSNPGQVLTHQQLLRKVWGQAFAEQSHYLRIYVSHLRKKLEVDATRPKYVLTEIGVGYRFVLENM